MSRPSRTKRVAWRRQTPKSVPRVSKPVNLSVQDRATDVVRRRGVPCTIRVVTVYATMVSGASAMEQGTTTVGTSDRELVGGGACGHVWPRSINNRHSCDTNGLDRLPPVPAVTRHAHGRTIDTTTQRVPQKTKREPAQAWTQK